MRQASDLAVWALTPVANPDDPRWLARRPIPKILVAARTAAEARILASRALASDERGGVANESGPAVTMVDDEKLYRVDKASTAQDVPESPGVIEIARNG